MATGKRPDGDIFAVGAKEGEVLDFPSVPRGWGVTVDGQDADGNSVTDPTNGIPPMEWVNALQKRIDENIWWLLQNALPDWLAGTWPKGAVVVNSDVVWRAQKDTTIEPGSDSDWLALFPLENLDVRYAPPQGVAVFSTPGQTAWQVPDELKNGRRKAFVRVTGGGGSGGLSWQNTDGATIAGGGAGGGYAEKLVDLTSVEFVDITVGTGGDAVHADEVNNALVGLSGGSSSFGAFVSATGGMGGYPYGASAARGGQGAGGDVNSSLGDGGSYGSGNGGGPGGIGCGGGGFSAPGYGGGGGGTYAFGDGANISSGAGKGGLVVITW